MPKQIGVFLYMKNIEFPCNQIDSLDKEKYFNPWSSHFFLTKSDSLSTFNFPSRPPGYKFLLVILVILAMMDNEANSRSPMLLNYRFLVVAL